MNIFPNFLLLSLEVSLMFAPTVLHDPGNHNVNNFLYCFLQMPQRKDLSFHSSKSLESGEIKTVLQGGSSREPLNRSANDSCLGMGLWRSFNCVLLLPVAARLLVFTVIMGREFSRLPLSWGVKIRIAQVKMPQN